ncbi:MAG TPA: DUF1343 domain-containing protein [Candidatus Didemnitutus sp.]|nr:DUF1343 domain-containing protein [Candidatus Didemnitutus sp.]
MNRIFTKKPMSMQARILKHFRNRRLVAPLVLLLAVASAFLFVPGCATKPESAPPPPKVAPPPVTPPKPVAPPVVEENLPPVMLGIDVLEAEHFAPIAGKRIGLLTHPAGVNRRGESTIEILRRAPHVKLVALFGPEHGIYGDIKAGDNIADSVDARTGLPVYSLHGKNRKPTPAQLKGLDAMVIDLQDIGVRSYTFASAMYCTMAACFEAGVEVVVLDRPNPLGGLKVDGPPLDAELKSYVGAFRVPYVHGLTIGELARLAKDSAGPMYIPEIINVPDAVRARGRLTVIPMRGWTRAMRWPETGLRWVPTSPMIASYDAVIGYAMVGLGTQNSGWTSGIGSFYAFRGIGFPKRTPEQIMAELGQYHIPGIELQRIPGVARDGKVIDGVYVEVANWEAWHPTELAFYMQKVAARWSAANPFARLSPADERTFKIHVGSSAWFSALKREGSRVDVAAYVRSWAERDAVYQQQSRKYWLYN